MSKPETPTRLIVVMAFEDEGGVRPASEPREFQSEQRAINEAKLLAQSYPAVIAWSREAKPDVGEYGEPTILFQHGDVPDME